MRDKMVSGKSELEKTISAGVHGTPQLKLDEKRRFLGFFRERVIQAITFKQLSTTTGFKAIEDALAHPQAASLVVHNQARPGAMRYIVAAQNQGINFTITNNPKLIGEVAVVVAAKVAVDVPKLECEI